MHLRSRSTNVFYPTRRYQHGTYKSLLKSFRPFNIYLWAHFVGYTQKLTFPLSRKFLAVTFISLLLSAVYEGMQIYINIADAVAVRKKNNLKLFYILSITILCEICLRFLVVVKRRQLHSLAKRLAKVYSLTAQNGKFRFRVNIPVVLIANDVVLALLTLLSFMRKKTTFDLTGRAVTISVCHVLINVNWLSPLICVYFCCVCCVLKHILLEFQSRLRQNNTKAESLFDIHCEILSIVDLMNETFHATLCLTFVISLTWIFYDSYLIMFTELDSDYTLLFLVSYIVFHGARFVCICLFSSSVTDLAGRMKETVLLHSPPFDGDRWQRLRLTLNVKDNSVRFVLFDKITVDKSLILSAAGVLITYGVMIVTFNAKT